LCAGLQVYSLEVHQHHAVIPQYATRLIIIIIIIIIIITIARYHTVIVTLLSIHVSPHRH
jgi:hypothetical protein